MRMGVGLRIRKRIAFARIWRCEVTFWLMNRAGGDRCVRFGGVGAGMRVAWGDVVRKPEVSGWLVGSQRTVRWFWVVCLMVGGVAALGCQVPVFRYALEQWAPSPYRVVVRVPRNGGGEEVSRAVALLRGAREAPVRVEEVEREGAATMEVFYPVRRGASAMRRVWESVLSVGEVEALLWSPLREDLVRRLFRGETAVWIFLESGDVAKDQAARGVVEAALVEARSVLKLPELGSADIGERKGAHELPPPRIDFGMVSLSRDRGEERVFVAMLTGVEDGLRERAGEPMAFPVFGRGRVLEPLIGRGITRENVLEYGGYLCGPCSCEVKEQNPGVDLLVTADWEPVDRAPRIEIVRIDAGRGGGREGGGEGALGVSLHAGLLVVAAGLVGWAMVRAAADRDV